MLRPCLHVVPGRRHKAVMRSDTLYSKDPSTIYYQSTRSRALCPNSCLSSWKKVCSHTCPARIVLEHRTRAQSVNTALFKTFISLIWKHFIHMFSGELVLLYLLTNYAAMYIHGYEFERNRSLEYYQMISIRFSAWRIVLHNILW